MIGYKAELKDLFKSMLKWMNRSDRDEYNVDVFLVNDRVVVNKLVDMMNILCKEIVELKCVNNLGKLGIGCIEIEVIDENRLDELKVLCKMYTA